MSSTPVKRACLVHVTTVAQTLLFLRGQPAFFRSKGFEVHAISSPGEVLTRFGEEQQVTVHAVPIRRTISPLHDLVSLFRLWRLFRLLKPQIVHAHTPKGGLLAMIAATLALVPGRIYHIHGLPLVTSHGLRRILLRWSDRVACRLAHCVFSVSQSVRQIAISEGLVIADRIEVLGNGSINGVDAEGRFRRSPEVLVAAVRFREKWAIPSHSPVIGFVGRLAREKGIAELAEAWTTLRQDFPDAHLLIVGGEEEHDPVPPETLRSLRLDPRAHLIGQDWETPPLYAAMNVLALPTYREGFVVTALEAAAMELPVVGTDVAGCRDAIVDGETGTLIPASDAGALVVALTRYINNSELSIRHGTNGRARAALLYRPLIVWESLLSVYHQITPKMNFL